MPQVQYERDINDNSKRLEVSRAQYSSLMAKNREIFAYTSEKSFRKEATAATRPRY